MQYLAYRRKSINAHLVEIISALGPRCWQIAIISEKGQVCGVAKNVFVYQERLYSGLVASNFNLPVFSRVSTFLP